MDADKGIYPSRRKAGIMSDDVSATLDALERKLRDLERELHGVSAPAASPSPAPTRGEGLGELAGQVDDLGVYRERLARTQRELEAEYGQMLGRLESLVGSEPAAAGSDPGAAVPSEPAAEATTGSDPVVADGPVLIDAGPFADLAALGTFERELAALGTVDVTGFEGRRAQIALWPEGAIDLAAALPGAAVTIDAPGRARVDL